MAADALRDRRHAPDDAGPLALAASLLLMRDAAPVAEAADGEAACVGSAPGRRRSWVSGKRLVQRHAVARKSGAGFSLTELGHVQESVRPALV